MSEYFLSACEFDEEGDDDGTDEHRQPEVGEYRAAKRYDRNPGEARESLEHAPEHDNDGRAQKGVADNFETVAHRTSVGNNGRRLRGGWL
jgi:hypothetical protein